MGEAFKYETVLKNGSRPIVYIAKGTHANYAVPGTHSHSFASIVVNDTTSAGPLWDPIISAYYYYVYSSSSIHGTFTSPDPTASVSWLSFLGR